MNDDSHDSIIFVQELVEVLIALKSPSNHLYLFLEHSLHHTRPTFRSTPA